MQPGMAKTSIMAQQKYEIGVYNQQVVELMSKGLRHKNLKDEWAENQYFQVMASSPEEAKRKIEARFAPENGYVVASVEIVRDA